jgi:hypothetical protein
MGMTGTSSLSKPGLKGMMYEPCQIVYVEGRALSRSEKFGMCAIGLRNQIIQHCRDLIFVQGVQLIEHVKYYNIY